MVVNFYMVFGCRNVFDEALFLVEPAGRRRLLETRLSIFNPCCSILSNHSWPTVMTLTILPKPTAMLPYPTLAMGPRSEMMRPAGSSGPISGLVSMLPSCSRRVITQISHASAVLGGAGLEDPSFATPPPRRRRPDCANAGRRSLIGLPEGVSRVFRSPIIQPLRNGVHSPGLHMRRVIWFVDAQAQLDRAGGPAASETKILSWPSPGR